MINKLKSRISFIIMISLSTVVLGTIILFAFFNYRNTINTATMMMDRFSNGDMRRNINERPEILKPEEEREIPEIPDIDIDGLYYLLVEDSKIVETSDSSYDKQVEEYAIKLSNKNNESGIIDKYVYKIRKIKENTSIVMIMENETAINHIRTIFIVSIIGSVVALISIYIISKKVSKIIVKPVQETFEKQKQFISDASHELKTPLAVIEANADVLENEVGTNKWLRYIQTETESMNKLVNELLLLTKIESTENLKEYEKFDLSKEVEFILAMFESMAYEKKLKINSEIQNDIIMEGNKEDIKHILSTLVDNAIKHTEQEKNIIVELSKEKNGIIMQVKNFGEPIPEEEREKIFERFYRVDKSRNRNEKRYGLGLAIAKSTVEKYKGKIEVNCKNNFTTFKVTIPV